MLPHIILSLLFLSGALGRPGWVVLVGALALTIASLEYVQARARTQHTAVSESNHLKAIAANAGDSLAYSTIAYLAGWLIASIMGWIPPA